MFHELYNDSSIKAMGIVNNDELIGIIITFLSIGARHLYYKTNSNMFVYKGCWFHGVVEQDSEKEIYLAVDKYGHIVVDGQSVYFKEIRNLTRL